MGVYVEILADNPREIRAPSAAHPGEARSDRLPLSSTETRGRATEGPGGLRVLALIVLLNFLTKCVSRGVSFTGFAKFTPLPLVELYVELQSDDAEIS